MLLYVLFLSVDYQIFIPVLISYFSVLLYKKIFVQRQLTDYQYIQVARVQKYNRTKINDFSCRGLLLHYQKLFGIVALKK